MTKSVTSPVENQPEHFEHPFGGCNRLLGHYRTIGNELLQIETEGSIGSLREGVAFVPVEVLESYLEDLLDLGVKEDTLFIKKEKHWVRSWQVSASGFGIALCSGLYAASVGASLPFALGVLVTIGLPFASLLYFSPKTGIIRRMSFAQILSAEISRRRGRDKDGSTPTSRLTFKDVLSASGQAAPIQGAAKSMLH